MKLKNSQVIQFIIMALLYGCSSHSVIQTQWDYPKNSRIRIIESASQQETIFSSKSQNLVFEGIIPCTIKLQVSNTDAYYVEIFTASQERIYGSMEVKAATKLTELSNVKIDLNEEIIRKIANNQVSQIVVNDPSAKVLILRLDLGNRMPEQMQKYYNEQKLMPY